MTDLEWCLAGEVSGRDDFLATPQLVSIGDSSHSRSNVQAGIDARVRFVMRFGEIRMVYWLVGLVKSSRAHNGSERSQCMGF